MNDIEESGASELVMVPWPHPLQTQEEPCLIEIHRHYIHERLMRRGSDTRRAVMSFRYIANYFGPGANPTKLKRQDWSSYEDWRYSTGVVAPTVRREITFHQAAMNHAHVCERIDKVPKIVKPSAEVIHERRAATEEEYRRLMRDGVMPYRIRMFFRLAYYTGHRAQAIEQLRWTSIDWDSRTIDFTNGKPTPKTKRRNRAFPIGDEFLPFLLSAYSRHQKRFPDDPYVIGAGARGAPSCTYAECKAAWRAVGVDVKGLSRHCFRKTFVTEKVKAGVKLETAAILIADAPATAGKYYFKLNQTDMHDAVNKRAA
jgi:integrase